MCDLSHDKANLSALQNGAKAADDRLVLGTARRVAFSNPCAELMVLCHITGVMLKGGETLAADLVVDASGRLSRVQSWLADGGYAKPRSVEVNSGVSYSDAVFDVPPEVCRRCNVGTGYLGHHAELPCQFVRNGLRRSDRKGRSGCFFADYVSLLI